MEQASYSSRRSLLTLTAFFIGGLASLLCHAAPPGWSLVWNDEFEGSSLDTTKWDPILWTTPFNNERQAYHPSRVTVSGGNLVLTADDADFGGKSYTSGKVESKSSNQYGRWEIRAKLPGTRGTWPAIWLLPDTAQYPWPSQGEIDILENRGNEPHLTSSAFHYGPDFFGHQFAYAEQRTSVLGQKVNYHDRFHTYAVEWDNSKIRFFVDDVHHYSVHDANVGDFLSRQSAPMELNLNVAVGGDFLGGAQPSGASIWPQQMLVDYVRVFERSETPPPVVFRNGDFEVQGGSLSAWSTFGNTLAANPNVQVHDQAVLQGSGALKLFGQFNGVENFSGIQQGISVAPGNSIAASASAFIRGSDSIAGTDNRVEMKFDYYSSFGGEFGSGDYLGSKSIALVDGSTAIDEWNTYELTDIVPAGAVEARLAFVFVQPNNQPGAVHIDNVAFTNLDLEFDADANGDGNVSGIDFLDWQRNFGRDDAAGVFDGDFNYDGGVSSLDLLVWNEQFGPGTLPVVAAVSLPEPNDTALVLAAMFRFTIRSRMKKNMRSEINRLMGTDSSFVILDLPRCPQRSTNWR